MGTRRAKKPRLALLFCLPAGCLLVWLLLPRETNLWKRARIIEPARDYVFPNGFRLNAGSVTADFPYCWTSSQQFLSLRSRNVPPPRQTLLFGGARFRSLTDTGPLSQFTAYTNDIHTAAQADIPELARFLSERPFSISLDGTSRPTSSMTVQFDFSMLVSPNLRWILWPATNNIGNNYAISVDGKTIEHWAARHYVSSTLWLRDNRRWVTLGESNPNQATIEIHDNTDLHTVTSHPVALSVGMVMIGSRPDGSVIAVDWQHPTLGRLQAAQFFPEMEGQTPRKFSIHIPPDMSAVPIVTPLLDPNGARLAWFVTMPAVPMGWPATRRLWSVWKIQPHSVIGLWTTRLDGSDPQEVGHYAQDGEGDLPSMLQWTPDSKALSFRYHGALYNVPVP